MSAPHLGVFLPSMSERLDGAPGDVAAAARHAERLGLESVWVVDQLISGSGTPLLDSGIALAAAAAVTSRIRLGYGVLVLPLRAAAWSAKLIASLQHVSGDRLLLGIGSGGDRHGGSWLATGVPRRERGRRTDAALRILPGLLSGEPTRLDDTSDSPVIQLRPAATMPPILVGGSSDVAIARTVSHGAGWFPLPMPPTPLAEAAARLAQVAATHGRPTPPITASVMVAFADDPSTPDRDSIIRKLTDQRGPYGIPADAADAVLVSGSVPDVATQLADLGAAGAERLVISFVAGEWHRQSELLAEAGTRLG